MPDLIHTLLERVQVNHVWLFLTERCNLSCDYCFFGDRDGRTTISMAKVRAVLKALPRGRSYDIVISGGEPLVEWQRAREVIKLVHSTMPQSRLLIQTNGLLLDSSRIAFLKANRVRLEFGLDGRSEVNAMHRKGIRAANYGRLVGNIRRAISAGIPASVTMTVHPAETGMMLENFIWLVEIGFTSIEVHPAFLAPWTRSRSGDFERGYRKIMARDMASGRHLVSKFYSRTVPPLMDLVVQPDGRVLPNWTYLIFPKPLREPFYLMDVQDKGVSLRIEAVAAYLKAVGKFFVRPRTYREFSNFNARRIIASKKDPRVVRAFRVYEQACRRAQVIDLRCYQAGKLFV